MIAALQISLAVPLAVNGFAVIRCELVGGPAGTDVVEAMDGSVSMADDVEVVDPAGETAEGEPRVDVAPVFVDLVPPLEQAEIAANDTAALKGFDVGSLASLA